MEQDAPSLCVLAPLSGRDVAALHDARPICLVGARSDEGEVGFATVIWATPISHSPAMVAFALREKSHTMGIIRATGRFSLCVPFADAEGIRLAELCGKNTGHAIDKGAAVPHDLVSMHAENACGKDLGKSPREGSGENCGKGREEIRRGETSEEKTCTSTAPSTDTSTNASTVPVPKHSYSWEAGVVDSIQPAGDHLLVIGTITRAHTHAPRDERGQLTPHDSLLCVQHGHYACASALSASS